MVHSFKLGSGNYVVRPLSTVQDYYYYKKKKKACCAQDVQLHSDVPRNALAKSASPPKKSVSR